MSQSRAPGGDESCRLENLIMIKRTPSRNSRSRSYKVKHVLQICLLLGVCFWLIYQVKHSHDKKKEFDEKDAKISVRAESGDGISNLGRKGLHPRVQEVTKDEKHEEDDDEETIVEEEVNKTKESNLKQKKVEDEMKNEEEEQEEEEGNKHEEEGREEGTKHEEEEQEEEEGNTREEEGREEEGTKHEEEEREEEEGNKHEDEEQEEETKIDETEDEGRGGGDDELDERDQEKIGGEADHEDDIVDEERGREEEGEDKESRNDEGEDKETQVDHETSTEDQDHDGGVQNDHEAREEQYNADDASSAVTHDTQTVSIEPEKVNSEKNENSVTNDSELMKNSDNNPENTDGDQKNTISQLGGVVADNGSPPNVTSGDKKDDEIIHSKDQLPIDANDQSVPSNKSMDVSTEAGNNPVGGNTEISGSSQPNETVVTSDSDKAQNVTVDGTNTGDASDLKTNKLELVNNTIASGVRGSDINSTNPDKTENNGDSNSSTNSVSDGSDKMVKPEVTAETGGNSGSSSITKETADGNQDGKSDINNESSGTDENSNSAADGTGAVVHDPIDSSDSAIGQDEKEALIDLSTLPENGEGVNSRDAAAE